MEVGNGGGQARRGARRRAVARSLFSEDPEILLRLGKLIECPICFDLLSFPLAVCRENGHAICGECRRSVASCPFCKSDWSYNRHILLEQILQALLQNCNHCKQYIPLSKLANHQKRLCKMRLMRCFIFSRAGQCTHTFRRDELVMHLYSKHCSKAWNIVLGEFVSVPTKNVFFTKNYSVLFKVRFPKENRRNFFALLRMFCDRGRRFFGISVNVLEEEDEEEEQFVYDFVIRQRGAPAQAYVGPCLRVSDMAPNPDRYPGGSPDARITVPQQSSLFVEYYHELYDFSVCIRRP